MVASLIVVTGPAQSGKTHYLLSRYRTALHSGKPGTVLWLAPTWRAAADVRNRILSDELEACWEPGVYTFDKFAQAILASSTEPIQHKGTVPISLQSKGTVPFSLRENLDSPPLRENVVSPQESIRPLSRSMKRQLVRYLIDEQHTHNRLQHFRPIVSTIGLVDLVCEFISELKRLEIWPEDLRHACQARGFTVKDRELLDLYEAYQVTLRENQLYDAEGRFWSARDRLQQGQRKPFENVRLAIADGFTDFTRTQHEILEHLAGWIDEIIISLPLEPEPRRSDLFTKPLKTLRELERRHHNLSVQKLPRPNNPSWPSINHLEKNLFINPRRVQSAHNTEGIEILSAAKHQGEMELIGASIKRLLAEGIARPGEIAVVFRSPQDAGGLIAEVFDRLGIPVALEIGQTLDRMPVMRTLKSLLQLDLDDWPFRRLLAVLGSNYFQPDWPEWQDGKAAKYLELTIRNLQIPRGRTTLLNQLAAAPEENSTLAILNRLAAILDDMPAKATLPQWAKAWEILAREIGLLTMIPRQSMGTSIKIHGLQSVDLGPANAGSNYDSLFQSDIIAWNRLTTALSAGDTLTRWLNRRGAELDRREAFNVLQDMLGSERMPVVDDESGRVRVLSAASVRSLHIPYLFLAGLSEKAFPPPDREDRLYSEAEYLQLIENGLPLVARTERMREEMLLFYEVLTRAIRRVYLSYPAFDDAAQPLSPSPYLIEVEQACGGAQIKRTQSADIRPIPSGDEPLTAAQFRVKAMADALSGDSSLFAGLLQNNIEPKHARMTELNSVSDPDGLQIRPTINLLSGLELIMLRQDRERFGPAEGMLPGKAVQKLMAGEFSSKRCFTASELEQYASCPYRFLLQNILKLEPLEDITLQLDALERGQIVHDVLASFHRRVNESLGRPGSPLELAAEEFDLLLQKALDDSLPRPSANPIRAALGEINRRIISKWLAGYRDQHQRYDKLWESYDAPLVPEFYEVSFGKSKHRQDSLSIDEPLEFSAGKDIIRVSGRIDRIDTGIIAQQVIFNVLDYKTGGYIKFSPEDVARGTALQLPLYALAGAELLLNDRDAIPWQAGYWNVGKKGFIPKQSLIMYKLAGDGVEPTAEWEEIREVLAKTVAGIVGGIRRGCFPVFNVDQRCTSYCPFNTLCRIRQIRSLEKTWLPTP
jgi:ATP-dependent helicase/nuclease subunit B